MTEGRVTVVWEVWGGRVIGGVRSTGLGAGRIRSRAGISKQRLPHNGVSSNYLFKRVGLKVYLLGLVGLELVRLSVLTSADGG